MGQVLHGCARTTEAIRRAIQGSKESIAKLSKDYYQMEKTVMYQRCRYGSKAATIGRLPLCLAVFNSTFSSLLLTSLFTKADYQISTVKLKEKRNRLLQKTEKKKGDYIYLLQ